MEAALTIAFSLTTFFVYMGTTISSTTTSSSSSPFVRHSWMAVNKLHSVSQSLCRVSVSLNQLRPQRYGRQQQADEGKEEDEGR